MMDTDLSSHLCVAVSVRNTGQGFMKGLGQCLRAHCSDLDLITKQCGTTSTVLCLPRCAFRRLQAVLTVDIHKDTVRTQLLNHSGNLLPEFRCRSSEVVGQ